MLSTEYNPTEIVFVLGLMIVGQSLHFGSILMWIIFFLCLLLKLSQLLGSSTQF